MIRLNLIGSLIAAILFVSSCNQHVIHNPPWSEYNFKMENIVKMECPDAPIKCIVIEDSGLSFFKKIQVYDVIFPCGGPGSIVYATQKGANDVDFFYYSHYDLFKNGFNCKNVPVMNMNKMEYKKVELSKLFIFENTVITEKNLGDYLNVIASFYYGRTKIQFDAKDVDQIRKKMPDEYKWMTKQKYLIDDNDKKKILFIRYGDFYRRGSVVEMTIKQNGEILSYKSTQFSVGWE